MIDKKKGDVSVREAASMEAVAQVQPGEQPGEFQSKPLSEMGPSGRSRTAAESVSDIVNHTFELPFRAQLGILRTIAPRILAAMDANDRAGFLVDLNREIERAEHGEEVYDVRPEREIESEGPRTT
jgi:hypothetical protein